MKPADHPVVEQPSYDLLNILGLIVMTGVHQHVCLGSRISREKEGHSPVGDVGVVKSRLEGFIFDQQSLPGMQFGMNSLERFLEPSDAMADALRSRIIRPVGEPR